MKRNLAGAAIATIVLGFSLAPVSQAAVNLALDAEVTLHGTFFVGGWAGGSVAPASSVTDGVFFPVGHQWNQGPVWWDAAYGRDQWIEIDLGGPRTIGGLIVQADNNDEYRVATWDADSSSWAPLTSIPRISAWGMYTRPNPYDHTEVYWLDVPVTTDRLRIEGYVLNSDQLFAVSEVQAFAPAIPAPGAVLLGTLGAGAVGWLRRRRAL